MTRARLDVVLELHQEAMALAKRCGEAALSKPATLLLRAANMLVLEAIEQQKEDSDVS